MKSLWIAAMMFISVASPSSAEEVQSVKVTRSGTQASTVGPAENFTGTVHIDSRFQGTGSARVGGATVTFEPGAHTAWHTHPLGQTLIVTAGTGRVQQWDGPIQEIRRGDTVWIPPGVKHWHGAAATTAMTHIAIAESLDGNAVTWMEKVSDAQYSPQSKLSTPALVQSPTSGSRTPVAPTNTQPTVAQKMFGDISPKFAQLTDDVLFGDVWERPELSKRDRSLVTVSALIAMNRPDQLRSHILRARENGVTQEEIIETITHLAFYAGWPSAVTAIGVAKEVFQTGQVKTSPN
jgi:4-carboxymuconolactone decarboxylase